MNLHEQKCDLFTVGNQYALAHCVSTDCAMAAGIVKVFVEKFPMMRDVVKTRHQGIGTACLYAEWDKDKGWTRVFNLITKPLFWHKPSLLSVRESLEDLKKYMLELNLSQIAMPRIASGLDRLPWDAVKQTISDVFSDTDIEILVCYLEH